jgi:NAD(P)-dependent dehydrogenase (short-subunit alcohol dehydrogenase family)
VDWPSAKVAVAGRNAEKAKACADSIGGYAAPFDGLSVADTRRMADDVAAHYGRVDILVNCVGLNQEAKAEEFDEERWDYVIDANLKSAMFQAQAAARHMIAQGRASRSTSARCAPNWDSADAVTPPTAPLRAAWRSSANNSPPSGRRTRST